MIEARRQIEFGDFQTPRNLAKTVISSIKRLDNFEKIIEPTCGTGIFLEVCLNSGVDIKKLEGWEINPVYVEQANLMFKEKYNVDLKVVKKQNFFEINWNQTSYSFKKPILFVGNPPWVTNSKLGLLEGQNLPQKYNVHQFNGIEAITGKSNFDISEWILIQLLNRINSSKSSIVFLIKTSVARKLFHYISKNKLSISDIAIRNIDAKFYFNVSVDACLFTASGNTEKVDIYQCALYKNILDEYPYSYMGIKNRQLISNINIYRQYSHIDKGSEFKWRSGIKHDAVEVMELNFENGLFTNTLLGKNSLPDDYLYPMYKSSNIAKEKLPPPSKYMLVTQKKVGDETKSISKISPKTWEYLGLNSGRLSARKSSIYKSSLEYSIFGVGDYTFMPWKIVISGFYKNIKFSKIGCFRGKPIVVDDTCYLLGFQQEDQVDFALQLLNSDECIRFIQSIIFLDSKRPITVALLNRINLLELAQSLELRKKYFKVFDKLLPQSLYI